MKVVITIVFDTISTWIQLFVVVALISIGRYNQTKLIVHFVAVVAEAVHCYFIVAVLSRLTVPVKRAVNVVVATFNNAEVETIVGLFLVATITFAVVPGTMLISF